MTGWMNDSNCDASTMYMKANESSEGEAEGVQARAISRDCPLAT